MDTDKIKDLFDNMAENYDNQWGDNAPMNDCLHLLMGAILKDLLENAHILCVGAGTGAEIIYLAKTFANWRFTAVDPSVSMLEVCRRKLEGLGMESRCNFHVGYVDSLPVTEKYDAATSILVSQFIMEIDLRKGFFRQISTLLKEGGKLISADLSSDIHSNEFDKLLYPWTRIMAGKDFSVDKMEAIRQVYSDELSMLPPYKITEIIKAGGFDNVVQFFQAAFIHGWYAIKK